LGVTEPEKVAPMPEFPEAQPTAVEAVVLSSILAEYRENRDPLVTYGMAPPVLKALGRGEWSQAQVRDLIVMTWTMFGRNIAPLSRFLAAADDLIERRRDRPNLKVKGIAKARAARRPRGDAELDRAG
jgi:hypothetical protein